MQVEISGAMIVQDEEPRVLKAIDNIYKYVDEIVIVDGGSKDRTIEVIKSYPDKGRKIKLYKYPFRDMIGDQKNMALSKVTGFWVLWLDADETFEAKFLSELRNMIITNKYEVFAFPRKNYIEGKLTEVYPDCQLRLFRSFCRYVKVPHEELVGWIHTKIKYFEEDGYHIIHPKSQSRQDKQDQLYDRINEESNFRASGFEDIEDYWEGKD